LLVSTVDPLAEEREDRCFGGRDHLAHGAQLRRPAGERCTLSHMRGLGVGAALLVALLVAGSHAGRTASGHGLIGLIAGESGESVPSPRFVLVHSDGTHARVRLGWVTDGALSPDARQIAYTPLGRSPAIWVAPTEGR